MSLWIDRIKEHQIWSLLTTLGSTIDQSLQSEDIDSQSIEGIERVRAVLSFLGKRLAGADPLIVSLSSFDEIAAAVKNTNAELQAFIANKNTGHITNVNSHCDSILLSLSRVIVPLTPDDTGALKDAAVSYRSTIENQLKSVKFSFSNIEVSIENLQTRIVELVKEITNEKTRLSALSSDFQSQFSTAQDTRGKEHTDSQTKRQEAFQKLITDYQTKLTEQNSDFSKRLDEENKNFSEKIKALQDGYETSAAEILSEVQEHKKQVEKLVGVIGNLGVTSGYLKTANSARIQTWIWQVVTVAALVCMIVFAYKAFLPVLNNSVSHKPIATDSATFEKTDQKMTSSDNHPASDFSWPGFAARLVLTLTVGVLAAYARSQADKNLEIEKRNRQMALELEALSPISRHFQLKNNMISGWQ